MERPCEGGEVSVRGPEMVGKPSTVDMLLLGQTRLLELVGAPPTFECDDTPFGGMKEYT